MIAVNEDIENLNSVLDVESGDYYKFAFDAPLATQITANEMEA